MTTDIWRASAVVSSGVRQGTAAGAALEQRANILEMTQATEDAVLRPTEPGAWSHELRAALAGRIARLNGSEALVAHYGAMADGSPLAQFADPTSRSTREPLATVLTFVDDVATKPKDITGDDIKGLQSAGIADADIVRLTELVAFMAYHVRLAAGLRLLAEMSS